MEKAVNCCAFPCPIFHVPLQDAFCSILLRPAADNRVYRREYNPDVAHNGNVYSA
jgi:hypothetical protein